MGFDFVNGIAPLVSTTSGATITTTDGSSSLTYTTAKLLISGAGATYSSSILLFKNGLLVSSSMTPY